MLFLPSKSRSPPPAAALQSLLYRDSINPTFPRWYLRHSGFPQKLICPDNRPKDWSPGITWQIPFKLSTIINRKLITTVLKDHTEEGPRAESLGEDLQIPPTTRSFVLRRKRSALIYAPFNITAPGRTNLV